MNPVHITSSNKPVKLNMFIWYESKDLPIYKKEGPLANG